LYFASRRPGGFGGSDIWVSHRLPTGKWSRPENLGEAVNTTGDEGCPFMHADNKTFILPAMVIPVMERQIYFFRKK
jgi:hypothetical protein